MNDLFCKKTGQPCQTPSMCAPFGGCQSPEQERTNSLERRIAELEGRVNRLSDPQRYIAPYAPLPTSGCCPHCSSPNHDGLPCPITARTVVEAFTIASVWGYTPLSAI